MREMCNNKKYLYGNHIFVLQTVLVDALTFLKILDF